MVQWQVTPVIVAFDGEHADPVQVQPLTVPGRDWEAFCGGRWRDMLEPVRAQVEGPGAAAGD